LSDHLESNHLQPVWRADGVLVESGIARPREPVVIAPGAKSVPGILLCFLYLCLLLAEDVAAKGTRISRLDRLVNLGLVVLESSSLSSRCACGSCSGACRTEGSFHARCIILRRLGCHGLGRRWLWEQFLGRAGLWPQGREQRRWRLGADRERR
jgi:hypothetical protein